MFLFLHACVCYWCWCPVYVYTHTYAYRIVIKASRMHTYFSIFFFVQLLRWTTRAYIYSRFILPSHIVKMLRKITRAWVDWIQQKEKIRIRWNIIFRDENNGDTRRLMKPIIKGKRNHSRFDNVFLTGAYSNHHL